MRINSITVTGWMPFAGTFTLELPAGPIAVVGMHGGDSRRSNRAGKTSLLEAITWCLYGVHRKRLDDSVINHAVELCEVEVVLDGIVVQRSRERGRSTKVVATMPDGVKLTGDAAQAAVIATVGLSFEDYSATSCVRQGEVESIIAQTSGDRLAVVNKWLQQNRWVDAKRAQAQKVNAADTRLGERRAALATAGAYLLSEEAKLAAETELAQLRGSLALLERKAEELSTKMMASVTAKTDLQHHAEVKSLRSQASELRTKLDGRAVADQRRAYAAATVSDMRARNLVTTAAVEELAEVQRSGFDGKCPVTCEQCPIADSVTHIVQSATALLTERRAKDRTTHDEWVAARTEHEAATQESRVFERLADQYRQIVARGKQLASSFTMTEEEAAAAPSGAPLQLEFEEARREASVASTRVGQLERMLADAEKHAERQATLGREVDEAERSSQVSSLALRAISSVPARIAAQQIGELELEANQLLEGSGVSLRFSWARELADKAAVCNECGYVYQSKRGDACVYCKAPRGKKLAQELEILCFDGSGVEEDARYNSGGTRAVVGSAIRLAASAMLRRLRSSRAAWAIVDEPFGSLDAENREQLARTFAGMLASVGLEQALVVSHDPVLLAALPSKIVVDKDGSNSTARLE